MGSNTQYKEFVDPNDWKNFADYLRNNNRFVLSNYWDEFFKIIIKTSKKREKAILKNTGFVRARIGSEWITLSEGAAQVSPISPKKMGAPDKHLAKEGRLNPHGIPYLYLSTNKDTAIAEIRPWISADISLGYFKILKDIKIIDTSEDGPKNPFFHYKFTKDKEKIFDVKKRTLESYTAIEKEECVWGDINSSFSTPISPNSSPLMYLPTQYLAEKLKTEEFDGIAYKSSLNKDGYNIAIFNPENAKCISCRKFTINQVEYKYEESGNPCSLSKDDEVLYQNVEILGPAETKGLQEKQKNVKKIG